MTAKQLFIFVGAALAIALLVAIGFNAYYERQEPASINGPKLVAAAAAFARDTARKGQAVPATVSLAQLISARYLSADDVRAFQGMDVKIWLSALNGRPGSVLMSAQLPDGSINAVLTDGSIQQFSAERFREQLRSAGQLDGSAKPSQAVSPVTNPAPAAAATPRSP